MHWAASFDGSLQLGKARVVCDNKYPHFGHQKNFVLLLD